MKKFDLTSTVIPVNGGRITPSGTSSHEFGGQVTVTAEPNEGFDFFVWSDACTGSSPCTVTMDRAQTVQAEFKVQQHTLRVTAKPSTGGSITPAGTTVYDHGAQVALTAKPSEGHNFVDWTGDCSGTGGCSVLMTGDISVTANFIELPVLTTSAGTGGTVAPFGANTYPLDSVVTVTAKPVSGYSFSNWSGACSGSGSCAVTTDGHKSVVANFKEDPKAYDLTTSTSPSAGGSISPFGTNSYPMGSEVTVTATPVTSYTFSNWSGACSGSGPCTVTMDGPKSVTANFVQQFSLTVSADPSEGGSVSPSGTTTYDTGTPVTVTANPASGYTFTGWSGDCSGSGPCAVTMDGPKSVTANFVQQFSLTTSASPSDGGSVSPSGTTTYNAGTEVTITASLASGYTFSNWSGACSGSGASLVTMTADKSVTANFTQTSDQSGKIAFAREPDGVNGWEIYVTDTDGSNITKITSTPGHNLDPVWSHDGSRFAFESHRDGNAEIYIMNADGSNQIRLTNQSGNDLHADWSPDGSKIAFSSERDGNREIYIMDANGSNQTRLTNNSARDDDPSFSPDGTKIAFASSRDGQREIYIMDSDGSNLTRIATNLFNDEVPRWSPNATKLAFVSDRDGNLEIYVMNVNGSSQIRLTNENSTDYIPSWSPSGARLAFRSDRDGRPQIYAMDSDGANVIRLTNFPGKDTEPDWRP